MSDDAFDGVFVAGVEAALLPKVEGFFPRPPPLSFLPLDVMFPFACNNRLANMLYLNEQEEKMAKRKKKNLKNKTYTYNNVQNVFSTCASDRQKQKPQLATPPCTQIVIRLEHECLVSEKNLLMTFLLKIRFQSEPRTIL